MIKKLNRPRMIPLVPLELKSQTNFVEGKNLTPTAMPSTAYITKVSGQSSILDLSVTIQNTSTDTPIEVKAIAIQLPVNTGSETTNLTTIAALSAIVSSVEGNLWNVNPGAISGQFLATPKTGDSNTFSPGDIAVFYLDAIALNTTVGSSSISIKVKDTSGIITDLSTTVTKEIAKAGITQFVAQDSNILPGATTSLVWNTDEIDYCLISPGFDNLKHPLDANGNLKVQPKETSLYTLLAYGTGVLLKSQTGINVKQPKIIAFGKTGNSPVTYGQNADLHWETNRYTTSIELTAVPAVATIPPTLPANGTLSIGPLTKNTTFTLTAYDATKNESTPVTLAVGVIDPLPIITEFSLGWEDNKLIAKWKTENATQVSLQPIPNYFLPTGTISVYPEYPLQSSYTLIAKNDSGKEVTKTWKATYDSLQKDTRSPIKTEGNPRSVAISSDSKTIYFTQEAGYLFSILDSKTLQAVPNSPINFEVNQKKTIVSKKDNRIYIITQSGRDTGLIILDSETLQQIEGSPFSFDDYLCNGGIVISPDFKRIYITSEDRSTVRVFDYTTLQQIEGSPMKTGIYPESIAVSKDNTRIFVTNSGENTLSVFNTETLLPIAESPIKVGKAPSCVRISPDGAKLYITNKGDSTLTILNAQTLQETPESPIKVGKYPTAIDFSVDGSCIFIGNVGGDNAVTILNAQTLKPTKGSPISIKQPYGFAISNSGIIYVSCFEDGLSILMPNFTEVAE
ncbi:YncE family protein [uncultured Aquimarina sp.]|uniref:YncE family protein n=1 Tax=uncultured Aquimarina sp. TaxID=575652 RepID=UPI002605CC3C|nr:YncE family protein [uncultured Aquimarina sp.]